MSNSQIGPNVPVGSMIAFAGNPTTLQQMEGWHVCDGRELHKDTHLELFDAIRYANGGNGSTTFKLPDCRGYFLRAVDQGAGRDPDVANRTAPPSVGNSGDNPGSLEGFATAQPASNNFTLNIPNLPNTSKKTNRGIDEVRVAQWNSNSPVYTLTGGDEETRPINNYVYFIIKYTQKTQAGTDVIIPVGSVIPVAGKPTSNQWLLCDGSQHASSQYNQLFQVIQNIHGGAPPNFYLPDYRGYFLRGVNGDRDPLDGDPDLGNRLYPQPGLPSGQQGAKGNNVGSVELTATAQANTKFAVAAPHLPTNRVWADKIAGYTNARFTDAIAHLTGPTGGAGTESRPKNAYVDWYIKASL
jgi:microcystin-dependent protein